MTEFPANALIPTRTLLWSRPGDDWVSIEIRFAAFELRGETQSTSARLDGVELKPGELASLAGVTRIFPPDPEDGSIEASIYLLARHVPFDVQRIEFGQADEDTLHARVFGRLKFSFVGGMEFDDVDLVLDASLRLELTPEKIHAAAARAVHAVGARSPGDLGKVMAHLAPQYGEDGPMAALNAAVRGLLA